MNAVIQFPTPAESEGFDLDTLESIPLDTPASLDLALLGPMRDQLKAMADMEDDLPEEQYALARKLESVIGALVAEQQRRLDAIVAENEADFDRFVTAKQPIEDRWIDDERQFWGKPRILDSKLYPSDAADPKRMDDGNTGTVAATRSRTLMCWARLCEMMLPANDLPFRVEPPDDPEIEDYPAQPQQQAAPQAPGQPPAAPPDPEAQAVELAKKAAARQQDRVFAMANKAGFKRIVRKSLYDAARIGLGLFAGPEPEIERKRRPAANGGMGDFEIIETPRAGMRYVNPWWFWYDMSQTLARSSCTFEAELFSRREMVDFKQYPRVMGDVIDALLKDDSGAKGISGKLREAVKKRNDYLDRKEEIDDVWVVMRVNRVMDPEKFTKATGIEWDHPEPPIVQMWSCAGRCIKWKITPLERDYRVPYYDLSVMQADDTIFGYSYPYLARAAQSLIDGAIAAAKANAGASAAPMLLVAQGKVHPNRENWKVRGLNVFSVENQEEGVEKAFASITVDSNVEQNLLLYKVGEQQMDNDTLFGEMQSGEVNGEEMPASGMVIAANLGSVFQKAIASNADENAFGPFAERMGWWDQMYSKNPVIGEFRYTGIAGTQLVSKDLSLQHLMAFSNFTSQPRFAGRTDDQALLEAFAGNIDGLPQGIVLDREKADANVAAMQQQAQQGDPNKAAEIASREKIALADIEAKQQLAAAEADLAREKMAADRYIEELKFKTALVQAQADAQIDMAKLDADFRTATQKDATDRFKATLDAQIKVGQQKQAQEHPGDPHTKFD